MLTWIALIIHIALLGLLGSVAIAALTSAVFFCLWLTGRSGSVVLAVAGSVIGIAAWCAVTFTLGAVLLLVLGLGIFLAGLGT